MTLHVTELAHRVQDHYEVKVPLAGKTSALTVTFFGRRPEGWLISTVTVRGPRGGELGAYESAELRDLLCGRRDRAPARVSGGRDIHTADAADGIRTLTFQSHYGNNKTSFRVEQRLLERLAELIFDHQLPVAGTLTDQPAPDPETFEARFFDELALRAHAMRSSDNAQRDELLRLADELRHRNQDQAGRDPRQRWQALLGDQQPIVARVGRPMTEALLARYLGDDPHSPQRLRAAAALRADRAVAELSDSDWQQIDADWRAHAR